MPSLEFAGTQSTHSTALKPSAGRLILHRALPTPFPTHCLCITMHIPPSIPINPPAAVRTVPHRTPRSLRSPTAPVPTSPSDPRFTSAGHRRTGRASPRPPGPCPLRGRGGGGGSAELRASLGAAPPPPSPRGHGDVRSRGGGQGRTPPRRPHPCF